MLSDPAKFNAKPGTPEWLEFQAKQMESKIDEQGMRQEQEEKNEDMWNLSDVDQEEDVVNYYVNKRR